MIPVMAVGVASQSRLSIIIPTLNESRAIAHTLLALQPLRQQGHQVIVVDGGSTDDTLNVSRPFVDKVLTASRGRARQMRVGVDHSDGDILWFLHADTVADREIVMSMRQLLSSSHVQWGYFQVSFENANILLALVARLMNLRSRITGIGTGDQGIFVSRKLYESVHGFDDIPLMEDISLCKKLGNVCQPDCQSGRLQTSARRWLDQGVTRTILLMWCLRLAFFMGIKPATLSRYYAASRT